MSVESSRYPIVWERCDLQRYRLHEPLPMFDALTLAYKNHSGCCPVCESHSALLWCCNASILQDAPHRNKSTDTNAKYFILKEKEKKKATNGKYINVVFVELASLLHLLLLFPKKKQQFKRLRHSLVRGFKFTNLHRTIEVNHQHTTDRSPPIFHTSLLK